jgi:hypothetical protein
MAPNLMILALQMWLILLAGCSRSDRFGISVHAPSGAYQVNIRFSSGRNCSIGDVEGATTVVDLPAPLPVSADLSWADSRGGRHQQHVQITPPASNGSEPMLYFVIQADNVAKFVDHNPD